MNNNEYVRLSLELHLFFDRIMKEHSLFLELAFTDKDKNLKNTANSFQQMFSNILSNAITLANGNITHDFISADEMVTKNTLEAEKKTSYLSNVLINTNITERELGLKSGTVTVNQQLLNNVKILNQKTLPIIRKLIHFKNNILDNVLSCNMYTTNYPLLIAHIRNEAVMYFNLLNKVEQRERFTKNYIYEQEAFWNNIMMEHAEFIRGLLDPSEKQLIMTADNFANEYEMIMNNNNSSDSISISLNETINFRDFKVAGEEGILNCKIKSVIIPLLSDHVVREANHFIRILRSSNVEKSTY